VDDEERFIEPIYPDDAKIIWLNVIRKAIDDFKYGVTAKGVDAKRAHIDARVWIWSEEDEFPSFVFLCKIFDLNIKAIRQELHGYELLRLSSPSSIQEDVLEL
jgi:hypothetical protein